ncbi:PAS domain S-box protein [Paenibacillus sp.]|uniref:PAS domain S-box protein n=1 Tax=Paenibacillus sp. TaxID=58172 RepID=UPI0028127217|nr:PAS domain S-box protein [Paenibacillus sp.]
MSTLAEHSLPLVLLAYTAAAVSAYAAFSFVERLLATQRMLWLFFGAATLSIGICSMHYIAMTAHHIEAAYRIGTVMASLIVSLSASFIAFLIIGLSKHGWGYLLASSAIFGVGAAVMHYVGSSSLIGVDLSYRPASIALTVSIGFLDAFIVFLLAYRWNSLLKKRITRLLCSVVMGTGMMGLHFAAVAGTTYTVMETHPSSFEQEWLGWVIFFATLFILALAVTCIYIDKRFEASEMRYKPLFEENPDAVLLVNQQGTILHSNGAATRVLGYLPDEYRHRDIRAFAVPPFVASVDELLEEAAEDGARPREIAFRAKTGDLVMLKLFAIPRMIDQDRQGVYVIGKDITESRRDLDRLVQEHEREKRDQETKFLTVVDSVLDALIMTDEDLHIVVWNQGAERIFGYSSEDVLGKSIDMIVPSRYLTRHRNGFQQYMDGSTPRIMGRVVELEGKRKEGEVFPIELSLNTWVADKRTYFSAVARDISERKRAERALAKSEEMYRDLIESFPEAILIGRGTRWVFVNASGIRLLGGTKPEDILQKSVFETVHPDFHQNVQRRIQLTEMQGKMSERMEEKWVRLDRGTLHVQVSAIPAKFNDEVARIVVVRDITELQKAREIYERSEKLAVAGELAAGIAHEIRNPLTAIKGFLQLTKEGMNPGYYAIIASEMDRIELIISELLMVAKPQKTSFVSEKLQNIVLHVAKLMESQANLNDVSIEIDLPEEDVWIRCDENQLKQVVINMLKNSIEAMDRGGVVQLRVVRVHSTAVHIVIRDEGPGIPEDKIANLGQPFYTTKDKGTGLGLMISYNIIRNHQGHVSVRSSADEGTTFTITLPISNPGKPKPV